MKYFERPEGQYNYADCVSYSVKQFFATNINLKHALPTCDLMTSHLNYDYVAKFGNYLYIGIELSHTFYVNQKIS